ncbi:MAG: ECF transporter S component [Candidatus Krumholzibacteria bacterium]|nr:ECF transporter S component [Candidatus Krumholzibacteria bacterium]
MVRAERRERKIILSALFTALSVALGYLLAGVPNVELMTLCVFLSGVFLGPRLGALVGALSIFFYSIFNPFGPALPPLILAQVGAFVLTGISGGFLRRYVRSSGRTAVMVSAVAGLVLTLVYDSLTTAATALIVLGHRGFLKGITGVFVVGSAFIAIHVLSNIAIFAVAVAPIVRVTAAWERGDGA